MDLASLDRWDEHTAAKDTMFRRTHDDDAPWTVVRADDKKRGRHAEPNPTVFRRPRGDR